MNYSNTSDDAEVVVFADVNLFPRDVVFKCLYWYGGKFRTNVSFADENTYRISVKPMNNDKFSVDEQGSLLQKLERDLIDFSLRDIVTKETKNIRDLLIAKAFSNGEFDEMPPGEFSDPVGFNINDINNG
jgi:His-Xaa-Ser system protein HxsD